MIHLIKQDGVFQRLVRIIVIHIARFVSSSTLFNHCSSLSYFQKWVLATVARRTGETTCEPSSFVLGTGTVCCQTNLCNKAPASNQMPVMVIVSFVVALAKIQWG